MNGNKSKRTQVELDSSDSDPEVSFGLCSRDLNKCPRLTMATADDVFFERFTKHMDKKADEIGLRLSLQLAPIQGQVNANSESIIEIKKSLARIEEEKNEALVLRRKTDQNDAKAERFLCSRRSGRFWSVEGGDDEIRDAAIKFLHEKLLVPAGEEIRKRVESVRRTRTAFSSRIKNEVLITFDSSSTQDFVFSHSAI